MAPKPDLDLTTAEGARAWIEEAKDLARAHFIAHGDLPPQAILLCCRDDRTGRAYPKPITMYVAVTSEIINDHGAGGRKDRFAVYLRRTAARTDAIGFVFISEAWSLNEEQRKKLTSDGSWENVPGRGEVLICNAQHKALGAGTLGWDAPITRPARGKPRLGPWSQQKENRLGRFSGVLLPEKFTKQAAEAMTNLFASGETLTAEERRDHMETALARLIAGGEISATDARANMLRLIAELREKGMEVAARPGDPPATDPEPKVEIVNIDEIPIPTEGGKQ